ncbi:MAG: molybdopterin dinucleotide binding domain-containing protein, partial [Terriglobales bacterium]
SYGHTKAPARFVAVGPRLSLTAANADEWWAARPGTENQIAWLLVALVAQRRGRAPRLPAAYRLPALTLAQVAAASGVAANVLTLAAERLAAADLSLVVGPGYQTDNRQAVDCQVAVNALNDLLGNTGRTVDPTRPHALSAVTRQSDLLNLFQGPTPRLLLLHHANPVYHHPAIMSALAQVPFKVSFSPWMDETTQFSDLILPDLDPLECWGDYSPQPAITGILQPCRVPLYPNRQTADVLLGGQGRFHQTLEAQWTARVGGTPAWNALLQKGVTSSAAVPSAAPPLASHSPLPTPHFPAAATTGEAATFAGTGELYLVLFPSVQFFDGRQANRSWAQEIAEPLSKLAWDGWCELHPATAERLGLKANDIVRLRSPYGTTESSLFISTWIRPDAVGVLMGQGHSNFGMWASERGENVHQLQQAWPELGQWHAQTVKVSLEKTGKQRALANLQAEKLQFDKQLALATSLDLADLAQEPPPGPSFYHFHHPYLHHRWGMAIDLDSCIGCNACQAACYAENNIAVWGRSSLLSHREMTWIRVELYEGSQRNPSTQLSPDLRFLPIPCQQCGNAPCEYVCPVFAAYHTDEGLNGQVYNRCVGTRYCSNNCIYKVRRFNWYTPQWPSPLDQQLNPAVTVRAKGIMEKCSFCVQRIEQVELDARTNKTGIPDGAIQTACMQTCPTDAIVFGDLLDPLSRVARLSADPRGYGLMADENTYPAVTYLRKVNFDLNAGPSYEGHGGVG